MYNVNTCLEILRNIKDVSFATVDEKGIPHNRIIDVMMVEDGKLFFCTSRGKNFYRQLEHNGVVAIVGMNSKYQTVRLTGKAKKLNNQKKWIDKIFEENNSMNDVYPGESRYILEPFCISDGEVEIFDLGISPIYRESFALGNGPVNPKGFFISQECIECDTCAIGCPQKCISSGEPYVINQSNCLHCGYCFEHCPVKAIIRKD